MIQSRFLIALIVVSGSLQIMKAGALSFTSSGSVDGNSTFECHKNITLNCKSDSNDNFYLSINSSQAVICTSSCFVVDLKHFYASHNSTSRLISLYMTSVTTNDEYTTFSCEEGVTSHTIQPKIKVFPRTGSVDMHASLVSDVVQIIFTTGCMLLQNKVSFVWKIRKDMPSSLPEDLFGGYFNQTDMPDNSRCDSASNCGATGMSSILTFKKAKDDEGEGYYIQCTISVLDGHAPEHDITLESNTPFRLIRDTTTISTISTTTSSSSLPPSSTDNFTTSSSKEPTITKRGKEQNPNADKTSTILIIAFSSIAGIALFLLVVCAINKIRKKRMKQSGASNNHEMET